jgi:hypothetical protein
VEETANRVQGQSNNERAAQIIVVLDSQLETRFGRLLFLIPLCQSTT